MFKTNSYIFEPYIAQLNISSYTWNVSKRISCRFTLYFMQRCRKFFSHTLHLSFFFDMAPGNVLCHHNRHLTGYFEFLHGLLIICLLLNIWGKLHWQHLFKKIGKAETHCFHLFIFVNTIQYAHIKKSSIDHSNGDHHYFFIWIPILHQFFSNYIF